MPDPSFSGTVRVPATNDQTIPAELVPELRLSLVTAIEGECDAIARDADDPDFDAAWQRLLRYRDALARFEPNPGSVDVDAPSDLVAAWAVAAAEFQRDEIRALTDPARDLSMTELFARTRGLAQRGSDLLALAEVAGWSEDAAA